MSFLNRNLELLAALLTLAIWPSPSDAQVQPKVEQMDTPDGSRFLLVRWGSSPLVHWLQAAPAGTAEDPPEYPGLSFAVARASLSGTRELGSRDWPAEELAIQTLENLELDRRRIESEGGTPDAELLAEIGKSRLIADQISDPFAWRRALLAAPAIDLQLSEADAVSLLAITCTMSGLPKVARLLKSRRDDAALRWLREAYLQVQAERDRQRRNPLNSVRHEILELALPGADRSGESTGQNLYHLGQTVFRRSQIPARCLHVIVGGFDPEKLKKVLQDVFRGDEERVEVPAEPVGWGTRRKQELSSSIPGGNRDAVAFAFEIPRGVNPSALAIVVDWLSKGPDSFLARGLRALGYRGLRVQGQAPFPGSATPGLLLAEIWEDRLPRPDQGPRKLVETVKQLLIAAAEVGPTIGEFNQAAARARGLRSKALASPLDLAYHLALACSALQQSPEDAMRATIDVSREQVLELTQSLLRDSPRSIVSTKRQK